LILLLKGNISFIIIGCFYGEIICQLLFQEVN
jgi:hypothetical protein